MKWAITRLFANFYFVHSNWQLPLYSYSQNSQSFITSDSVLSPTCVSHGKTNVVSHLHSSHTLTLSYERLPNLLLCLDYCLPVFTPISVIPSLLQLEATPLQFNYLN